MSKKNGRKLFSKADGTSFIEDIHEISDEVKAFFHAVPPHLKKWMAEATDVVDFIQRVSDALEDGQPADTVIDFVLSQIPGSADEELYKIAKDKLKYLLNLFEDWTIKIEAATDIISEYSNHELDGLEACTVAQLSVYFYKS